MIFVFVYKLINNIKPLKIIRKPIRLTFEINQNST